MIALGEGYRLFGEATGCFAVILRSARIFEETNRSKLMVYAY